MRPVVPPQRHGPYHFSHGSAWPLPPSAQSPSPDRQPRLPSTGLGWNRCPSCPGQVRGPFLRFARLGSPAPAVPGNRERNRKFVDSPLEGTGFELLVRGRGEAGSGPCSALPDPVTLLTRPRLVHQCVRVSYLAPDI